MFNNARILILEDVFMIAHELAETVAGLGAQPTGPFAKVSEGFECLDQQGFDGAILDARLLDEEVTSLALVLIERKIPFVIHSGTGCPTELAALHPDLPVILKPAPSTQVAVRLLAEMQRILV